MIHIISMPFITISKPNIATGLIKSILKQARFEAQEFLFNFDFARLIGINEFECLALQKGFETQAGEWLFARQVWGDDFGPNASEFIKLCGKAPIVGLKKENFEEWMNRTRQDVVPVFLKSCLEKLEKAGPIKTIAFSCTFFQTLPSLALAKIVKDKYPESKILFGGACFHDEMGREYIKKIPWIDFISNGEADSVIVPLFKCVHNRQIDPNILSELEGISWRNNAGKVIHGRMSKPVASEVLEKNPMPDFSEYLKEIKKNHTLLPETKKMFFSLLFESSRGCWKGEKMHCTFCGLNNKGICFRQKKPDTVRKELEKQISLAKEEIKDNHNISFMATDCIFPKTYFESFVKDIRDNPFKENTTILCETRTTITRDQVKLLADGGFNFIQSGIESLSTNILKCMNKGVTAIKNVHFLKLCRTYGIYPLWNILIRVPGEKKEDYDWMNTLIPKIIHYTPPYNGARVVELQRFSPYFSSPGKWVNNIVPRKWYTGLYPKDKININRIAYFFDADWKDTLDDPQIYSKITCTSEQWIKIWRFSKTLPDLTYRPGDKDNSIIISDTRNNLKSGSYELERDEALIYMAADDPVTLNEIQKSYDSHYKNINDKNKKMDKTQVLKLLDTFIKTGLMIRDNKQYLSLAVPFNSSRFSYELRSSEINLDEKSDSLLI